MSEHARRIGQPSSMARTFACPGWGARSEEIEQEETEWATEGQRAHKIANMAFKTGSDVSRRARDDEMVEHVQFYLDTCRSLIQPEDIWGSEAKVSCEIYHSAVWGTCDFWRFRPSTGELVVIDLKYGIKNQVSVIRNPQLMTYALGGALQLEVYGKALYIWMGVCQPRGLGEPMTWDGIGPAELYEWGAEMSKAVTAAENATSADLVAGEHCTYCPALAVCETASSSALPALSGGGEFSDPTGYSVDTLARALEVVPFARQWCTAVERFATAQAEKGHSIPGFKLTEVTGHRKWKSNLELKKWAEANQQTHNLYAPAKLKSPAQMEKAIGKQYADFLEPLWEKPVSGSKLVPIKQSADEKQTTIDLEFQPRQLETLK